jgi:murein tripeptide amidase MpaA
MVNPDGVIHGNSRTNLLGYDVNRKWEILPNKKMAYETFTLITELIKKIPQI